MIALLDTHLVLWAVYASARLGAEAREILESEDTEPRFSAANLWEMGITPALGRPDFTADARTLRRALLSNGWTELPITGSHAIEAAALPAPHRDPFDRILLAQARIEGIILLTADQAVAAYGSPARLVRPAA